MRIDNVDRGLSIHLQRGDHVVRDLPQQQLPVVCLVPVRPCEVGPSDDTRDVLPHSVAVTNDLAGNIMLSALKLDRHNQRFAS